MDFANHSSDYMQGYNAGVSSVSKEKATLESQIRYLEASRGHLSRCLDKASKKSLFFKTLFCISLGAIVALSVALWIVLANSNSSKMTPSQISCKYDELMSVACLTNTITSIDADILVPKSAGLEKIDESYWREEGKFKLRNVKHGKIVAESHWYGNVVKGNSLVSDAFNDLVEVKDGEELRLKTIAKDSRFNEAIQFDYKNRTYVVAAASSSPNSLILFGWHFTIGKDNDYLINLANQRPEARNATTDFWWRDSFWKKTLYGKVPLVTDNASKEVLERLVVYRNDEDNICLKFEVVKETK